MLTYAFGSHLLDWLGLCLVLLYSIRQNRQLARIERAERARRIAERIGK